MPRKGRDVAALVYWSVISEELNLKIKCADQKQKNAAKRPKCSEFRQQLGEKAEYDTDIEEQDPADGFVKWFRYKRYWNLLEGWENFLSGECYKVSSLAAGSLSP